MIKTAAVWFLIFFLGVVHSAHGETLASARSQKIPLKNVSAGVLAKKQVVLKKTPKAHKPIKGIGSWYSRNSPGIRKKTASGERFDDSKRTCAAWNYPMGTRVKVTNLKNGKSVVCRVNDRGPSKRLKRRIIDLSRASFVQIGKLHEGLITVSVTPLRD